MTEQSAKRPVHEMTGDYCNSCGRIVSDGLHNGFNECVKRGFATARKVSR